ncbi:hypothetical protein QRN89_12105 [Streptomyces chengbuensis]|uniref:hypothetical protein n=1 Tax=Streptomyces TaxID=1883 RepID=UPI0025B4719D|nr:hypothetical protein [Streptomyces sp. HUAS CB01]WJY50492.1 hypothetical protein QRN89_12105 [Streptomyces sp. HUAS CB01]
MRQRLLKLVPRLPGFAVPALAASALWAVWLGWDQHRDVHPDGTTTGPYQAWQVIGLVLTLSAPVYWAASRGHIAGAVLGTTAGLTAAAFVDWSDDASGLYAVGAGMVMVGSLVATTAVSAVIASAKRHGAGAAARE